MTGEPPLSAMMNARTNELTAMAMTANRGGNAPSCAAMMTSSTGWKPVGSRVTHQYAASVSMIRIGMRTALVQPGRVPMRNAMPNMRNAPKSITARGAIGERNSASQSTLEIPTRIQVRNPTHFVFSSLTFIRLRSSDHLLVKLTILRYDGVDVELAFGEVAAVAAEAALEVGSGEDLDRARGHRLHVADRKEIAGFTFDDYLGQAAGAAADDGYFRRHRFERGHAEGLRFGCKEENVRGPDHFFEVGNVAEEED